MRPEHLSVALRPRPAMEAVDLGFALAQRHAADIWSAWLRFVLPVMLLLALLEHVLMGDGGFNGMLLWWAKPFYDVVVLLVLSRAVFGEKLSTSELAAELRGATGQIVAALTLRRLSLSRSFLLPAHLLEGLRGKARRARINLLQESTRTSARLTTITCSWAEWSAMFGLASLVIWFAPQHFQGDLLATFFTEPGTVEALFLKCVYIVAISIIEPFYVAAGFALYLNRRTQLEGWDIEVSLRRIAARLPVVEASAMEPQATTPAAAATATTANASAGGNP